MPSVGAQDVLIRVHACGVCASELHAWQGDAGAYPRALGHEVAGEVIEVGDHVRTIMPGIRVTGLFHRGFAEYALAPRIVSWRSQTTLSYETGIGEPIACIVSAALSHARRIGGHRRCRWARLHGPIDATSDPPQGSRADHRVRPPRRCAGTRPAVRSGRGAASQ